MVSEGGLYAQGSFTAFGTETDAGDLGSAPVPAASNRRVLFSSITADRKGHRAEVLLQRYEVDFVLERSHWKILHLQVVEYFRCPYDRNRVRYARECFATDGMWLEALFTTPDSLPEDAHGKIFRIYPPPITDNTLRTAFLAVSRHFFLPCANTAISLVGIIKHCISFRYQKCKRQTSSLHN